MENTTMKTFTAEELREKAGGAIENGREDIAEMLNYAADMAERIAEAKRTNDNFRKSGWVSKHLYTRPELVTELNTQLDYIKRGSIAYEC